MQFIRLQRQWHRPSILLPQCTFFTKTGVWEDFSLTLARQVETHWQEKFEGQEQQQKQWQLQQNQQDNGSNITATKGSKYILAMFPYPSGELHLGHVRVYATSDAFARYWRSNNYQVVHPLGWDAFGLPAENAAIEHNRRPASWTGANIAAMRSQLRHMGCRFDWWREVSTCDARYYRWTQALFLRLHAAGLVYRKQAWVSWDPVDQTVVAAEQVDESGHAWRSGALVERRLLRQWFIRTTRLAEQLLRGLDDPRLSDWQDTINRQKGWIGRCDGYTLYFTIVPSVAHRQNAEGGSSIVVSDTSNNTQSTSNTKIIEDSDNDEISVYLEHPELLCGASFLAVRSNHELNNTYPNNSNDSNSNGRILPISALNPLSGDRLPILVKDDVPYASEAAEVYIGYGGGTLDDRRVCREFGFPVVDVVAGGGILDWLEETKRDVNDNEEKTNITNVHNINERATSFENTDLEGTSSKIASSKTSSLTLINSVFLTGLGPRKARTEAVQRLQDAGKGCYPSSPILKDWLISRQRYWGTPIPMIHCSTCGTVPVPATDLPVLLPPLPGSDNNNSDQSKECKPLATVDLATAAHNPAWRCCSCPKCGSPAQRETDTMDTFVDSSWYFLRFLDPHNTSEPFSPTVTDPVMPVDLYVGGAEHAVLHLYYARFMQQFLHLSGYSKHAEPFTRLLLMGRIKAAAYRRCSDGKYLRKHEVVSDPAGGGSLVEAGTGAAVEVVQEKMSKSKYNGVDPTALMNEHSVDVVRLAVLSDFSPHSNRGWNESGGGVTSGGITSGGVTSGGLVGSTAWICKLWLTIGEFLQMRQFGLDAVHRSDTRRPCSSADVARYCEALTEARNRSVRTVTRHYRDTLQLNLVVYSLHSLTAALRSVHPSVIETQEFQHGLAALLVMVAPLIPHLAEELWHAFVAHNTVGITESSVQNQPWPEVDVDYTHVIRIACSVDHDEVVDVKIPEPESLTLKKSDLVELFLENPKVQQHLAGRTVLRSMLGRKAGKQVRTGGDGKKKTEAGKEVKQHDVTWKEGTPPERLVLDLFTLDGKALRQKIKEDKKRRKEFRQIQGIKSGGGQERTAD